MAVCVGMGVGALQEPVGPVGCQVTRADGWACGLARVGGLCYTGGTDWLGRAGATGWNVGKRKAYSW